MCKPNGTGVTNVDTSWPGVNRVFSEMSGEISKNLFPLDGPNETLGSRSRFEDHYWKISLQICEAKVVDTKYIKKAHEKDGFWTAVESAHDHRVCSLERIHCVLDGRAD